MPFLGSTSHGLGAGGVEIKETNALEREDGGDRGQLKLALRSAAHDGRRPRVATREVLRRNGRGGACPQCRHATGLHDGQRGAIGRVGQHDSALNGGAAETPWIVRKVGVRLCREVAALAQQSSRLDVEPPTGGGHAQNAGGQRPTFRVKAKCPLDGVDTVVERQEIEYIGA